MKRLFLILVLLIFIAGCQQGGQEKPTGPFLGGKEGISIEFAGGAPPTRINAGEEASVKALIKNKGEYDVAEGDVKARLIGLKLEDYSLSGDYIANDNALKGKSNALPLGGEQQVDFGKLKYLRDVTNTFSPVLKAMVCYFYKTKGQIDVCVKSLSIEESGATAVCDIKGEKVVQGSVWSAPVQITSLTESYSGGNDITYTIVVENVGGGDVYHTDATCENIADVTSDKRKDNENKVGIEIKDDEIRCVFRTGEEGNSGVIDLETGKATLKCSKAVDNEYGDKLDVELSYRYVSRAEKQITIEKTR